MDSQSLTQFNQTPAETQMRVLKIVLQIIILSTLVLFVTSLGIIFRLCLRELRQPRPGSPRLQEVEDEGAWSQVSVDLHYWRLRDPLLCQSVFALVRHLVSTSVFPLPMRTRYQL